MNKLHVLVAASLFHYSLTRLWTSEDEIRVMVDFGKKINDDYKFDHPPLTERRLFAVIQGSRK